jgi:predicted nucleic acid-binding protein
MRYLLDTDTCIHFLRRRESSVKRRLIGPNDLLIASIALANEATLVTHNTDEFQRVDGLHIEDWQIG